jgi:DNA repair protein RecO (recombination protein O)
MQAETVANIATALRKFEMSLLSELGYALQLTEDADTRDSIDADERYIYVMERGPICVRNLAKNNWQHAEPHFQSSASDGLQLSGKTLLDLAAGDFSDPQTQVQSKLLMRRAINQLLGDKPLHTRQLIRDLKDI